MDSGVTLPACKISTKISEKRHYYKNKKQNGKDYDTEQIISLAYKSQSGKCTAEPTLSLTEAA
jgi:hypothetical protein